MHCVTVAGSHRPQVKWMNRTYTKTLLWVVFGLLLLGLPVRSLAQEPTRQDLTRMLARLDQKLLEVSELVAAFSNPGAAQLLQRAQQLREQAASRIANNMPRLAALDLQAASQLAEQAVKVALEAPLQRLRSQLEELLRRAENEVIGSGQRDAEQFLQQAKKAQAGAEEALKAMTYRRAIDFYRLAINLAQRSLDLAHGRGANTGASAADSERDQFETLAVRAREAVEGSQNASARNIYDQAIKQGRSADNSMRSGHPAMALQLYHGAIRLLLRAIDLANSGTAGAATRLEGDLALLEDLISSAERQLESRRDPRGALLITRARILVNEARQALDRKNEGEAEWRLTLARNFVSKALRTDQPGLAAFELRLDDEISQLKEDIRDLEQRAREQGNSDAGDVVSFAQAACTRAERAANTGKPRLALQAVLAAQRFLSNAEALLSRAATPAVGRQEVAQKLDRLDAFVQEAAPTVNASQDEVSIDLLQQVVEIRDRAREAFNRGRMQVANESAGVATEMLRSAVKISTAAPDRPDD